MLKKQIQLDAIKALKKGNQIVVTVLRMLLSSVNSKEKDKRYKLFKEKPDLSEEKLVAESSLSEEQVIEVIISEVKKRKDAIVLYEKGNRPELAEKEKKEIEILQKYLPVQLSVEDLKKIIEESINKTEAKEIKDMGRVMADLSPKIKGKADNSEVSKIVKELLL